MIGPMENRPSAPDKGLSMSPLARLAPFVFGLIGVTVIVFLWSQPFGEFGSPPLFFRIFGSLIASVFILVGFGGAFFPQTIGRLPRTGAAGHSKAGGRYQCPNCSAALERGADVSPSGDVRCTYCERWFNVHSPG